MAAFSSAVILASSLLPLATSAAPNAAPSWLPEIRNSAAIDGPALIQGRLVDEQGVGRAGRVEVIAWPTLKVLGSLEVGERAKTLAVGKATTDAAGNFVVRVDPAVPIGQYMEKDGTINFDATGTSGAQSTVVAFPRRLDTAPSATWVSPGFPAKAGVTGAEVVELRLGAPIDADAGVPAPAEATDKDELDCKPEVVATYNQRKDIVGEVYTGPHATGDFQYQASSSSTLGVGISVSGAYGSFSASGTAAASSTASIDYPTASANQLKVWQTTFQYKKFRTYAFNSNNLNCHVHRYEIRPTGWQGGSASYNAASAPTVTSSNCSPQLAGVTVTKDSANAVTFSNGMSLGSVVGIDLSTRTGFSTKTKIVFKFTSAGKLCGTNTTWPTANRVVGK